LHLALNNYFINVKNMEANKKFVVDSGSARGSNITIEEVQQALRDIDNWLRSTIPSYSPPPPLPSPPNDLPAFLRACLSQSNGGIQLHETFKTLSIEQIQQALSQNSSSPSYPASSIPFSSNPDGDFLLTLSSGEVVQWNSEGIVETLSNNLGLFLESLRNKMLTRKFQYLGEECGLIEGV
jgi:hypothetical protein